MYEIPYNFEIHFVPCSTHGVDTDAPWEEYMGNRINGYKHDKQNGNNEDIPTN